MTDYEIWCTQVYRNQACLKENNLLWEEKRYLERNLLVYEYRIVKNDSDQIIFKQYFERNTGKGDEEELSLEEHLPTWIFPPRY